MSIEVIATCFVYVLWMVIVFMILGLIRGLNRRVTDLETARGDDLTRGLAASWGQRAGNGVWERVTRLDVIRPLPNGRLSETTDGVEWALQDDGRTLKLWIDGRWRDRQEGTVHE